MDPDTIKINKGTSKGCVIALLILICICLGAIAVLLSLYFTSSNSVEELSECSGQKKTLEKTKAENEKAIQSNKAKINEKHENITQLQDDINKILSESRTCQKEIIEQVQEINFIQEANSYLWVGGVASAGIVVGSTTLGLYEMHKTNKLSQYLTSLKEQQKEKELQIKKLEKKKAELIENIAMLELELFRLNTELTSKLLEKRIQQDNFTQLTKINETKSLNNSNLKKHMEQLVHYNLIFLSEGTVALAASIAEGYWLYKIYKSRRDLEGNIKTTANQYDHFKKYFDQSKLWVAQDYVSHYFGADVRLRTLYNSSLQGFSKSQLITALKGIPNTLTLIRSKNNWTVAAVITQPWKVDDFTADENAYILSVNRGWESVCPPDDETHLKCKTAARLQSSGSSLLEFGNGEILLYQNQTGTSNAGITFTNFDTVKSISASEFYFGENPFTIAEIEVFQFYIP